MIARFFLIFFIVLSMLATGYIMKYHIKNDYEKIADLEEKIETEKQKIARLKAEWIILTRPERVQFLVDESLEMVPPRHQQIIKPRNLTFYKDNQN